MRSLRHRLRACIVLWLLGQTLSLGALVPTECCAAHHVAAASASDCHQETPAQDEAVCPMHGSGGADCPMHARSASAESAEPCAMRAFCNAPASALAMLIPVPGVLAVAPSVPHVATSVALVVPVPTPVERALSHDTPPPRA